MNKQQNLCNKHGITQDELQDAIHKILENVPVDTLSPKMTDAIFDLLRFGDLVDEEDQKIQRILRHASLIMSAQQKCEDCLINGACYNKKRKDGKKQETSGCLSSLMCFAQDIPCIDPAKEKAEALAYYKKFAECYLEVFGIEDFEDIEVKAVQNDGDK